MNNTIYNAQCIHHYAIQCTCTMYIVHCIVQCALVNMICLCALMNMSVRFNEHVCAL